MLGRNSPAVSELAERPAWWRRRAVPVTLVAALGLGAITADAMAQDSSAAKTIKTTPTTSLPARMPLSTEPQLSVNDESRMRHDFELIAEIDLFLKSIKPRINYDPAFWYALHHCEQANTWHAGGHFGNGLTSGGDGLGMSLGAWQTAVFDAAKRGVKLPSSAWDANPDQQMEGAQAFMEDNGWRWQCPRPAP